MSKPVLYLLLFFFASCASLPKQDLSYNQEKKISVGEGPEDFELDSMFNRLIVSCDNRRVENCFGELWGIDLETDNAYKLDVKFTDSIADFHPHGISIKGDLLFVISHKSNDVDEVFRFKIFEDSVVQEAVFNASLIGYGNDIFAVSSSEFYYSDYKMFGGSIVHCLDGNCQKFSKHYKYPNGIFILNEQMFVTTSLSNKLFLVDLYTGKKKAIARIKGGDNLLFDGEKLYTTSHPKIFKFIKHVKSSVNPSPTVVYEIDPVSYKTKVIYSESGNTISAGSTGWVHNGKLYISQIFENFVWVGTIK
jgi:hypothetical protein